MITPEEDPTAVCSACGAEMEGDSTACFHCGHARRSPPMKKGQVIDDRYELTGVLGRGGMGTVYQAHDRSLDERVALKVLSETARGSAEADRRFRAEIKLARKIRHPNVCAIHEYGELPDIQYIVMEFVDGQDLKKYVRSRGELPTAEAIDLARQIGEGLQAIHDAGVIHRDLKLANVMRDSTGRLRLMDFGIAKGMGDTTATATGHVVGTPEYMSPEQARGERVDSRSDVYALGIVTYELLTGRVPFKADTPLATLMMHVHEPPRLDDPRIPTQVVPVLRKALAKTPDERYAGVRDFLTALTQAPFSPATRPTGRVTPAGGRPELTATMVAPGLPRVARTRWVGVSGGAILGLGLAVWFVFQFVKSSNSRQEPGIPQPISEPWPSSGAAAPVTTPDLPQPTPAPIPTTARTVAARTPTTATARSTTPPVPAASEPKLRPTPTALALPPTAAPARTVERADDAMPQATASPAPATTPAAPARPTPAAELQRSPEAQRVPETSAARDAVAPAAAPRPAASALLVISVKPAAEIAVDGKVLADAPAYTTVVAPGEHVIRFTHKNWQPLTRTVSVASGERLKVAVDLKDEAIPRKK